MTTIDHFLSRADFFCLEKNHQYSNWGAALEQDSLKSRVHALAISPICAVGLMVKASVDLGKLASRGIRSAWNRRLETGNIQLGAVYACEYLRGLAGTLLGSVAGLVSPSTARNLFLVNSDTLLPRCLDPVKAAKLYAITNRVTTFFREHGIDYRMTSGTFLGAIRHKGVIPWDDDVDLFLAPEAAKSLKAMVDDGSFTRDTGLSVMWDDNTGGWRAFFADGESCAGILGEARFPFIDLFTTTYTEDARIVYKSKLMRSWAPQEYFTLDEWNDERNYPFGPITIKGPANWEDYFARSFGEGGKDFAYLLYHHNDFSLKKWPQRVFVDTRGGVQYDQGLFDQLKNGKEKTEAAS